MALQFTTNQGIRVLDDTEYVWNVPAAIAATVADVEKLVVQRFTSAAQRDQKVPLPEEGMVCWLRDVKTLSVHDGTAWQRVWPMQPKITSSTDAPVGTGATGDIHFQYA